jgi:hypothetical protein
MCIFREFAEPVNVQPEWVHLLLPGVYQCVWDVPRGGCELRLPEAEDALLKE